MLILFAQAMWSHPREGNEELEDLWTGPKMATIGMRTLASAPVYARGPGLAQPHLDPASAAREPGDHGQMAAGPSGSCCPCREAEMWNGV